MTIKKMLFDVDGVLIRIPHRYSYYLQKSGFPNAPDALDKFYKSDTPCTIGIKDPLKEIKPYLEEFGWRKSPREYFDRQFEFESDYLDILLIDKITSLIKCGIQCYLATDQNHYRKKYLLNELGFASIFNGYFVSSDIGYRKIDNEYWEHSIMQLRIGCPDLKNEEIIFIDDRIENIKIAKGFGIEAFHTPDEKSIESLHSFIDIEIEKRRNRTIAST